MNMTNEPDLVIRNCSIIDGSGAASFSGEVAIDNGVIAGAGPKLGLNPLSEIDAGGAVVCPGFIDVHTHDDLYLLFNPQGHAKVRQGITTSVIGHCGISPAPGVSGHWPELESCLSLLGARHFEQGVLKPMGFAGFLDMLEKARPGINIASLVGHTTIRLAAMGSVNRAATQDEIKHMQQLVRQAMLEGAYGISTGLIYPPGSYAQTDELVGLAREAASLGGLYSTHLRNEASGVETALQEALDIGRQAGVRVQISHHKVGGKPNWGRSRATLEMIEKARAQGMEVTADQYPYTAGSTYLAATLPPDIQEGGAGYYCAKLKEPGFRAEVIRRIQTQSGPEWENYVLSLGFEGIVVASSPTRPECAGLSIARIAELDGADPMDALLDLLIADHAATGAIYHSMNEDDVTRIMTRPYVMVGSDGIPAFSENDKVHPRFYSSFPRVLGHYVRQKGILSLEDAVRKMTSLSASTFGLKGKGLIRPGMDADLVIFDPEAVAGPGSFGDPAKEPEGIHMVMVGGRVAVDKGRVTGRARGKILRRGTN